jgi:hypothetical protein
MLARKSGLLLSRRQGAQLGCALDRHVTNVAPGAAVGAI